MQKLPVLLLLILILGSCSEELDNPLTESTTIGDIEYQVITVASTDNINVTIEALTSNTILNLSGGVYSIEEDITISNKENIIIEGNNSTFKYLGGYRFTVDESSNVMIRDLIVDNNNTKANTDENALDTDHFGRIQGFNSIDLVLENIKMNSQPLSTATYGVLHQILLKECEHSVVRNCEINNSRGELIMLDGGISCLIENNRLTRGWSGVGTTGSSESRIGYNNRVIGNTVINSEAAFITINDRNALVADNIIYNDSASLTHGPGIRLGHAEDYKHASNAILRNNIIRNLNYPGPLYANAFDAIKVDYSQSPESNHEYTDLIIEGNKIIDCAGGISVTNQSGQHLLIKNNEIKVRKRFAIDLFAVIPGAAHSCLAYNNTIYADSVAIKAHNTSLHLVDNNITSYSVSPGNRTVWIVKATTSNDYLIEDNVINQQDSVGTGIHYSFDNSLTHASILGNIIKNGSYGLYVRGTDLMIKDNIIKNTSTNSIYVYYNATRTTIEGNHTYNAHNESVYLYTTVDTKVIDNYFNYTAGTYSYAIWKNGTNVNCTISGNVLTNYTNSSN